MSNPGIEWTKVLIHPLGLVGYVLFLLFGVLSRVTRRDERRWLLPATLAAAGIVLLGGLGLAYRDVDRQAHEAITVPSPPQPLPTTQQQQHNEHIQQSSTGAQSPNVQGVQGDVNLTYGATPGEEHNKPARKKTSPRKETAGTVSTK